MLAAAGVRCGRQPVGAQQNKNDRMRAIFACRRRPRRYRSARSSSLAAVRRDGARLFSGRARR